MPWKNGTTHVEFEPMEFIAKLAALVPSPRAHLTRFHGVVAPNAKLRAQLTPSGRGKRPPTDAESIDVSACVHFGGALRIVASIEEPTAIRAILARLCRVTPRRP